MRLYLEEQRPLVPWRTADTSNGFGASVATDQSFPAQPQPVPALAKTAPRSCPEEFTPIRAASGETIARRP